MLYRFYSLEDEKDLLSFGKNIWILNDSLVKIPVEQLELLREYYVKLDEEKALLFKSVFEILETQYYEATRAGAVYKAPLAVKKGILESIDYLILLIKSADELIYKKCEEIYQMYYYNSEYINMLKALKQLFKRAIELNLSIETWLD